MFSTYSFKNKDSSTTSSSSDILDLLGIDMNETKMSRLFPSLSKTAKQQSNVCYYLLSFNIFLFIIFL